MSTTDLYWRLGFWSPSSSVMKLTTNPRDLFITLMSTEDLWLLVCQLLQKTCYIALGLFHRTPGLYESNLRRHIFTEGFNQTVEYYLSCLELQLIMFRLTNEHIQNYNWSYPELQLVMSRITTDRVQNYNWSCQELQLNIFRITTGLIQNYNWSCPELQLILSRITIDRVQNCNWSCLDLLIVIFKNKISS